MKLFARLLFTLLNLLILVSSEDNQFLYKSTKICARHKSYLCLTYDSKNSAIVLGSGSRRLKFEIETVERINMQLNRVYAYARDKSTGKHVKSCLVRKPFGDGTFGVDLAPCDTDDRELVLAVEIPAIEFDKLTTDEFILKEISYLDDGNSVSSPYCISASHDEEGHLTAANQKKELLKGSPIILTDCETEERAFGQEFRARGFKKSVSQRLLPEESVQIEAEIGMFCLSHAPDLCLGMSLTNGDLAGDKFVQVKNLTKNEAKNTHDLKMRWYHDLPNQRVATASNMDLCLEAVYDAPIGNNRKGVPQFDDIVHLGNCDGSIGKTTSGLQDLQKSEKFYLHHVTTPAASYMEIRTNVPSTSEAKCISIVKCVKHDNDHCTPYNSVPVFESQLLSQGAHARLKDCNSEDMVSQRFYYISDDEVTVPPTKFPTEKPTLRPTTKTPTSIPTMGPTTSSPTLFPTTDGNTPTKQPTFVAEPIAPTPNTETDEGTTDITPTSTSSESSSLLALLAIVGVLSLLIILVALAYYLKNRRELAGLPEEDENFIARV